MLTTTPRQRLAISALLWSAANEWNAEAEDLPHRESIAALAIADAMTAVARKIDRGMDPAEACDSVLVVVADIEATLSGLDIEPYEVQANV